MSQKKSFDLIDYFKLYDFKFRGVDCSVVIFIRD